MPLINTSVPNLIQGVSQQPDATRHAGQCEEQENALSSVVDGLKKRPNTRHVARLLTTAINSDSFVHFIDRDDNEKYVVIHDGSKLRVFNLNTGNEGTINGASNKYYDPANGSYLDTSTPRNDLKALTIADNTFILNTTKAVDMNQSDVSDPVNKDAFVFVKQGDFSRNYRVIFNENSTATITQSFQLMHMQGGVYHFRNIAAIDYGGSGYPANVNNIFWFNYTTYGGATPVYLVTNSNGVVTGFRYQSTTYTSSFVLVSQNSPITFPPLPSPSASGTSIGQISTTTDSASANNSNGAGARSTAIITSLYNHADANTTLKSYFDLSSKGNGIRFTLKSSANTEDFYIRTQDDLSGNGLGLLYKEISALSSLPLNCPNDFKIKIIGDAELNQDDYYVQFKTGNGSDWSEGAWEECIGFSQLQSLDASTMPMTLINDGVDSFLLKPVDWDKRTVGDDLSNPIPSFVGKTINNMGLFKNRLVMLSDTDVVFSEAGHFFNFFKTTTTTLLDSAPIDVAVNSSGVTKLRNALGFQENLILFSNDAQFALKGGDLLTPKSVSITPITNFTYEDQVDPFPLGSYIYFPFTRGQYTGVREFTVNSTTDTYDSVEITEHIPAYIPKNIIDMAGTTTEDLLVILSGDETDALYIYNYFWNNNQKVLSSWSKFTFDDDIRGIEFIDSTLYMVTVDDHNNTHLLELPMEADAAEVDHSGNAAPFRTLVDKRVRAKITQGSDLIAFEQPDGTYSSANADQPYTYFNGSIPSGGATLPEVFVDSNGNEYALKYQNIGSGGQVLLSNGAATSTSYGYVGIPYTMKYKFSTQVFKASSGNSASPTAASSMQVRNGVLFFDDTHTFDVKVTPDGRSEVTETFSADDRPEAETLGNRKFAEGNFRFPVHSKAKNVEIVVENDSPFDSKFSSAEFESFVHPRSRRYG